MSASDSQPLLLAPVATLLPPCETALLLAQVPQASLIVLRVGDLLPCGESREVCKAEVYPTKSPVPGSEVQGSSAEKLT